VGKRGRWGRGGNGGLEQKKKRQTGWENGTRLKQDMKQLYRDQLKKFSGDGHRRQWFCVGSLAWGKRTRVKGEGGTVKGGWKANWPSKGNGTTRKDQGKREHGNEGLAGTRGTAVGGG